MEAIWLLVGLLMGAAGGGWAVVRLERAHRAGRESVEAARLQGELAGAEAARADLVAAREELLALVKQGAGEELAQRGSEVVERVQAHLRSALTQAGADDEKRKQQVESVVEPVTRTLGQLTEKLDKVDAAREQTATQLTAHLSTVQEGQREVAQNAAKLERGLRQPHVRGRWGEMSLRRMAEMAGMSHLCDFVEQSRVAGEDGGLCPDMLVKVPGGRLIVVDAKVSLAPYLDAMEATTDAERVARLKLFARATRAHVRKLAAKAYAAQFSTAPDFVVMYMPGDHFLAGALRRTRTCWSMRSASRSTSPRRRPSSRS